MRAKILPRALESLLLPRHIGMIVDIKPHPYPVSRFIYTFKDECGLTWAVRAVDIQILDRQMVFPFMEE